MKYALVLILGLVIGVGLADLILDAGPKQNLELQALKQEGQRLKSQLDAYINEKDAEYIDEFTFKEHDHFFVGIPNSYAFEGITEDFVGYPGCQLDKYGFEKMLDVNGNEIPYFDSEIK